MEKRYISSQQIYNDLGELRIEHIKSSLFSEKYLNKPDFLDLISKAQKQTTSEPNLLEITDSVTILGDIHGQFYDLLHIFSLAGPPSSTSYLFLGDYVDRGGFSVETLTLLLVYKLSYPSTFHILRGNHESRSMTSGYGFRNEVLAKYDQEVYDSIMDLFDTFPIAALINNSILAVHGGISMKIKKISEINLIQRFREPPNKGPLCDMLWSDPNYDELETKVLPNTVRGCGILYNKKFLSEFLKSNNLISLVRAHEQCENGFKLKYWEDSTLPSLITVFSAPNYCDSYGNKGAIVTLNDYHLNIKQFHHSEHPYLLPNHKNAIEWSAPYVISKLLQIFAKLLEKPEATDSIDDYLIKRIKEIDPKFSLTSKLQSKIARKRTTSSDLSIEIPEEHYELHIPIVSQYQPSLQFNRGSQI